MAYRAMKNAEIPAEATDRKVVERNTYRYRLGDDTVIRLHLTDIVTIKPDGRVVLKADGWLTPTTKDRMNTHLPERYSIDSVGGVWKVHDHETGKWRAFYEGITLPDAFDKEDMTADIAALAKKVRHFCHSKKGAPFGHPDCPDCQQDVDDLLEHRHWGSPGDGNVPHLLMHMADHVVPSSLRDAALLWAGYKREFVMGFLGGPSGDTCRRSLRRYLRRRLGIG